MHVEINGVRSLERAKYNGLLLQLDVHRTAEGSYVEIPNGGTRNALLKRNYKKQNNVVSMVQFRSDSLSSIAHDSHIYCQKLIKRDLSF